MVGPHHALGSRPDLTTMLEDSPTNTISTSTAGTGATVSASTSGADATIFASTIGVDAVVASTVVASVPAPGASGTDVPLAGSSSTTSSRSITSADGGTPGATSSPTGPAAGAEEEGGTSACSALDADALPSVAAADAASTRGATTSPTAPPPTPGRAPVYPTEAANALSAFFEASGGI